MSESKNSGDNTLSVTPSKTLSLKRPVESGIVRQSFSHGRSKAVVVEKVKRRTIGGEAHPAPAPPPPPAPAPAPAAARPASSERAHGETSQKPSAARQAAGVVLRSLTEEEREARARALTGAREREDEERRVALIEMRERE